MRNVIPERSGTAFKMKEGQLLSVYDVEGEQVSDMLAFNASDTREVISSGRTLDYASKIYLTTGDRLYSNRSNVMFTIEEDSVGRHDFLLTPCSKDTFRIIYNDEHPHHGCFGNFERALAPFAIMPDQIPIAFNCFMNVVIDPGDWSITVQPPKSKAGDFIRFRAQMDLIVALTACSALQSNNYAFKTIEYEVT